MPEQSLDYCALHYLNQYYSQDCKYIEMFDGGKQSRDEKRRLLREAATFYRVARNVPGNDKDDPARERYEPVLQVLTRTSRTDFSVNTVKKIEQVERRLWVATGRKNRVTSFTTKMLWLMHQDDIIIYDSLARKGLGIPGAELDEFYGTWRQRFEMKRNEIFDACGRLPNRHKHVYNAGRTSADDIRHTIQFQWFHERVFDIYLWFKGDT